MREAVATHAAASESDHHPVEDTAGAGPGAISCEPEPETKALSCPRAPRGRPRSGSLVPPCRGRAKRAAGALCSVHSKVEMPAVPLWGKHGKGELGRRHDAAAFRIVISK